MQIRTHFQSITVCLRDLFHARESVRYVSVLLCVTSNEPQPMWICLLTAVVMGCSIFNGWNRYLQSYHNWSPACQNLTLSALSITTVFPELAWLKFGLRCLFRTWMFASCRLQRIWARYARQLQWYPLKCGGFIDNASKSWPVDYLFRLNPGSSLFLTVTGIKPV